jgi:membrane-associated phospholipid phosphatase
MRPKKQIKKAARKLLAADEHAYRSLEPYTDTWPIRVISGVGAMGDQGPLRLVTAATGLGGLLSGDRRLMRAAFRMIIAHELATALKNVVKGRVDRARPKHAERRDDRKLKKGKRTEKAVTSFPSGHSAGSIAVARAFSREFPEHSTAAIGAAATVAAAQVPKCSHYITDVVAGLAVGLVAETVVDLAWDRFKMAA